MPVIPAFSYISLYYNYTTIYIFWQHLKAFSVYIAQKEFISYSIYTKEMSAFADIGNGEDSIISRKGYLKAPEAHGIDSFGR